MKKTFLLITTAFLLPLMAGAQSPAPAIPKPALAHDMKMPMGGGMMPEGVGMHHDMTLEEARKHAHEMAAKLDKMTPAEWNERQARRKAFFAKVDKMTPAERDAFFQERRERHQKWMQMTPAQRDAAKAEHGMNMDGGPEIPGGHE
jgi:hypothetical protein